MRAGGLCSGAERVLGEVRSTLSDYAAGVDFTEARTQLKKGGQRSDVVLFSIRLCIFEAIE